MARIEIVALCLFFQLSFVYADCPTTFQTQEKKFFYDFEELKTKLMDNPISNKDAYGNTYEFSFCGSTNKAFGCSDSVAVCQQSSMNAYVDIGLASELTFQENSEELDGGFTAIYLGSETNMCTSKITGKVEVRRETVVVFVCDRDATAASMGAVTPTANDEVKYGDVKCKYQFEVKSPWTCPNQEGRNVEKAAVVIGCIILVVMLCALLAKFGNLKSAKEFHPTNVKYAESDKEKGERDGEYSLIDDDDDPLLREQK